MKVGFRVPLGILVKYYLEELEATKSDIFSTIKSLEHEVFNAIEGQPHCRPSSSPRGCDSPPGKTAKTLINEYALFRQ